MALLHSLQICGIRNFSPDSHQTVYFNTPVVLFQGPNGSGKTTILESIRYALTGELPGGTTGGKGFVNEPKMSNKNSTKGNIKIKFSDAEGNIITVNKVAQVQMNNKGELTFKKLTPSIRKRPKDDLSNVQDISGRCADVDSFCCTSINVSKSIFNNVLFCHQENSLWPLDEPKKLKEKFDEIFDAVRYNKCIDHIRKQIKDQQGTIRMCEKELELRKEKKEEVDKKRAKLEDKKDKLKQIQNSIEEKINEMKPLDERMKKILELEESLGALQRKFTGKEEEKKGLVNQQKLLQKDISYVFEGTDEELQSKITYFKDEQSIEESAIKKLEMSIRSLNKEIDSANRNIQNKQVQIGQMKEQQNQYNEKKEKSNNLIDNLRTELEVEDFGDQEILLGELSNALKTVESRFNELKKEKDAEENELQSQIDTLREKNAKTEQMIASKTGSIKENEAKLKEIQCKLEELDTSDSQLRNITGKIESLQSDLSKIKNSFDENKKLREIQELKDQIETKEQYLDKLERENRILQRNYATEQNIETQRNMILEKQGQISRIKTKHSSHFSKLFSGAFPEKDLKRSVLNIQNTQEVELKKVSTSISSLDKQITSVETTLKHSKDQLKIRQQELSTKKQKVAELCKGRDFNTVLAETYKKKEKLQKDKGHYTAAEIMYKAFIDKFEEKSCCPVCKTDFKDNRTAIPDIIRELKGKIEQIPSGLVKVEGELKKEEVFYNKLQQLKTINDAIQNLTNEEIPELEKKIGTLDEEFTEKSMSLAELKQQQEQPQQTIEICKTIITDATLFDQYNTDIRNANSTIQDLEESIERVPSNRSRLETESEIDAVKGQLSNAKNGYETNKNMLESHRERYQELNKKIQNEVQRQLDIQKLVQEKPLLESQNTEINEKLVVLKIEVEELKVNISSHKQELKEAIETKRKATITNNQIKETARKNLNSHQNSLNEIQKLLKLIHEYEKNQSKDKLQKAVEELAELKVSLETLEKTKTTNLESVSEKKESIAKRDSDFRALKDNVTLRKIQNKQAIVEAEVEELRQKIEGANYQQVYEEKQRKMDEINKKQREKNNLIGQQEEVQTQIDELSEELSKADNRNAHNFHKKAYYELTLNKLAVEDLTKYVNVLEKSVLKFHEERMVQINTTIRKLWRTIYRGNDIDYIEIKTDDTLAAGKRRSYNYKVVQVKNSIELDMRGRCSAGQKVLACLVIRMALAETFSSHCGILALDEPTTNLDKANISSLSDALSELITSRENQTNFQLLIITHDEEFLRSITQVQSLDSYWQVKRNHKGFSTVDKVML
ncbi:DNA repair protein RAD50 [Diabrotica undecimpunctata]|uniref:DNA repair protein RAD50 n=1 Tax=Diabrotica undecimpunctata TaxID=50387 RepID=UPI003B63A3B4